ncbi:MULTISPECIES: hypothetical protein [Rhizobium]|uniref:hypothetical protein n=1 Tax=Rhizobium TaxID=379 RepID=UPI0023A99AE9|nr:hypothetical protein [Rhizobium sp. MJ22]WEA27817.1 hypothetical protein PO862_11060 [Rhizobium sp. MJ22]
MSKHEIAAELFNTAIASEAEAVISGVELDPMLREQMDLEDGMIEAGKSRYWRLVADAASKPDRGADGIVYQEDRDEDEGGSSWLVWLLLLGLIGGGTWWVVRRA